MLNWFFVSLGFFSIFALGLLDNARGPVFPDIGNDLGLGPEQASLFFAVASGLAFFGSQFSPWLRRHMSLFNGLRIGLFLLALGFILISRSESLASLLGSCAVFGFGMGIINVYENLLIQEGTPVAHQRRFFSGLHSVYALSSLIGPFLIGLLIQMEWNWRQNYFAFSFVPLTAILVSILGNGQQQKVTLANAATHDATKKSPKPDRFATWAVGFSMAFYVAGELSLSTRLSSLLRAEHGYSAADGSFLLGLFFVALFVGRLGFTLFKTHRVSNYSILQYCLWISTASYLLGLHLSPWFFALTGLVMAPFFGISVAYFNEVFGKAVVPALSFGLAAGSCTVVPMQLAVGFMQAHVGLTRALLVGPLCLVASSILLWAHHRKGRPFKGA